MAYTIVFVPFFEARPVQLQAHRQLVESWGYKTRWVSLKYTFGFKDWIQHFSLQRMWAAQISEVLDSIEGPVVVWAFSNPSASALVALSSGRYSNVRGLICDSGPSAEFFTSVLALMRHYRGLKVLAWPAAYLLWLLWGWDWNRQTQNAVKKLPEGFPVLSIRCGKDLLISPAQIEKAFRFGSHLKLVVYEFKDSAHLTGFKDHPDQYADYLKLFLDKIWSS